jgi:NTP pyrophosphatase (non-canonical NTP hydrolase)
MSKRYETRVLEICDNGDAIIEITQEMMDEFGWNVGDELNCTFGDNCVVINKPVNNGKGMNMYQDVKTFIEACDQPKTEGNQSLYANLIQEEYDEFVNAIHAEDDVEQLDACMDMIWVILGYCYMKGYNVSGAWGEVARSNLAKINPETGKVNKRSDGKVLKPEGWKAPDLKDFV